MWDRPDILNRISSLLFTLALLLAAYGALHFITHLPVFLLREVRVNGVLAHLTGEQVETLVRREIKGNFFTLDLAAARAAFEKLPWVRKVNVRRQWPGRLEVMLEEHVPLARWGSLALVNTYGEEFEAAYDGKLPLFAGPAGSAKEVTIQYEYFRKSLAAIARVPVQVRVSPRRAWQIRLDDGTMLELGREQIEARLARFVSSYERTLGRLGRRIDYVDLRYTNGFAVRIPELRPEKAGPRERKGAA
ncbi:MAG: cell division protein FtsQ/DivIB [Burkholderiales bacterium]|nr:cell division protein FtsQ/DivIB [Burkholderiales bacterium]